MVLLIVGLVIVMIIPLKTNAHEINTATKHKIVCAGESAISFEADVTNVAILTGTEKEVVNIEEVAVDYCRMMSLLMVEETTFKFATGGAMTMKICDVNSTIDLSKAGYAIDMKTTTGGAMTMKICDIDVDSNFTLICDRERHLDFAIGGASQRICDIDVNGESSINQSHGFLNDTQQTATGGAFSRIWLISSAINS